MAEYLRYVGGICRRIRSSVLKGVSTHAFGFLKKIKIIGIYVIVEEARKIVFIVCWQI